MLRLQPQLLQILYLPPLIINLLMIIEQPVSIILVPTLVILNEVLVDLILDHEELLPCLFVQLPFLLVLLQLH